MVKHNVLLASHHTSSLGFMRTVKKKGVVVMPKRVHRLRFRFDGPGVSRLGCHHYTHEGINTIPIRVPLYSLQVLLINP